MKKTQKWCAFGCCYKDKIGEIIDEARLGVRVRNFLISKSMCTVIADPVITEPKPVAVKPPSLRKPVEKKTKE